MRWTSWPRIVTAHEEVHGALTEQEIEAIRRELFGDKNAEQSAT
ncbi:hypothetical protein [Streptomyces sp. SID14515]|nr:hypothetical protein [Streptomyces sp. SID14515]